MQLRDFSKDTRAGAALELALWVAILALPLLNVIDIGLYVFRRMQVENAGQMAVQSAWGSCDDSSEQRPVTTKCQPSGGTLETYMRSIAQGSNSLTTDITMTAPTVKYYCLNNSNSLIVVATAPTAPPSNCTSVSTASPSAKPGEYVQATVSYAYTPMFGPLSVANTFATPITYTARARID